MVEILVKIKKKDRGFDFSMPREKWERATETLLRGESPEVWKAKFDELNAQRINGPFYQALRDLLVSDNNKNKKRKRR